MPGFVWMMEGSGEPGTGNTAHKIDGDPQFVSNLTVWEDVASLEKFVWGTIHKQFYEWSYLKDAQMWETHGCAQVAAE